MIHPRGITGNAETESAELQNARALTAQYLAGICPETQAQTSRRLCRNCGETGILVEGRRKSGNESRRWRKRRARSSAIRCMLDRTQTALSAATWGDRWVTLRAMIAHLRGTLFSKHPNQAIVETHGVGYDVVISVPTFSDLPAPGGEVALYIHTHVREDALSLYGFLRMSEKLLFEKLLTVSGIGPKLAITILSGMPADEMVGAIRGADLARLTRIPGIGKKTAERMVLELRDKLPAIAGSPEVSLAAASPLEEDVLSALVNLGYQRSAAEKALQASTRPDQAAQNFDLLFREALARLSK